MEERLAALAIVAALMGHASDVTASRHYGRPSRDGKGMGNLPIAVADPEEVARIRQVIKLHRLSDLKGAPKGPAGP
jgi:hypothetical protein